MKQADAGILWEVANVLAREAADVSGALRPGLPGLPPMLFFTDPQRTPSPWETAARLPAGSGVVFRHFGRAEARDTALRLREATSARGVVLLIALDVDLAESVGADGVHLPERALDQAAAIQAARPDWLISGATHSRAGLETSGLDALIVSPVFPAGGPSADRPALGLTTFSAWARAAASPVYALGGISSSTAPSLIGSGARGLAAVSAIQAAFAPD